jgi:hypothetical protein
MIDPLPSIQQIISLRSRDWTVSAERADSRIPSEVVGLSRK